MLSLTVNGKRIGRSGLAMVSQEYLQRLESDAIALESQLYKLIQLRPEAAARYHEQWLDIRARLESDAFKQTGVTVQIETPAWVLLQFGGQPTVQSAHDNKANERKYGSNKQCVPGDAGGAAQGPDGLRTVG